MNNTALECGAGSRKTGNQEKNILESVSLNFLNTTQSSNHQKRRPPSHVG